MDQKNFSHQQTEENEGGMPFQVMLLLGVIALGLVALALKFIGVV